ncbi:MAG TPA: (2Fe-2S)-binding protein [Candidatus Baltobacteraceae bacterium]|nr:(2Fe-2S)-binding protein [Candidatus Baltobacteraceae bacterium]
MVPTASKVLRRLRLNGASVECAFSPNKTLLEVLREDLGLTGTKHGCELGQCGACTVLIDGEPQLACLLLAVDCEDREILTIEGLAKHGRLHPLQKAFIDTGATQCGYCTPGMILSGAALLSANPNPTKEDAKAALSGNLCRCTGYAKIIEAVMLAAEAMRHDR